MDALTPPGLVGPLAPGPDEPPWLQIARGELGVHRIPGSESNARILEYFTATTLKVTSDEIPSCSAFVNWCLRQAGKPYTKSAAAKSWIPYGAIALDRKPGDIVVLHNPNMVTDTRSGYHVTFGIWEDTGGILGLGCNQDKMVCFKYYHRSHGWAEVARRRPA